MDFDKSGWKRLQVKTDSSELDFSGHIVSESRSWSFVTRNHRGSKYIPLVSNRQQVSQGHEVSSQETETTEVPNISHWWEISYIWTGDPIDLEGNTNTNTVIILIQLVEGSGSEYPRCDSGLQVGVWCIIYVVGMCVHCVLVWWHRHLVSLHSTSFLTCTLMMTQTEYFSCVKNLKIFFRTEAWMISVKRLTNLHPIVLSIGPMWFEWTSTTQ